MTEIQLLQDPVDDNTTSSPSSSFSSSITNGLSLRQKLFPFYQKWITGVFPTRDMRSLVNKCSTFSTMLISSRYVSAEHPFGFGRVLGGVGDVPGLEKSKDKKDKEEKEKEKKDKKDKKGGKKDKKDKKDKKGKKDKKDKKDKDGKDKKDKKDKKDGKDKKDKKDKKEKKDKDKDKKDKKEKKDKDKSDKKKDKENNDPVVRLQSVRDTLMRREGESISVFAPCMTFVKCPFGAEGEECTALKKAASAALNADRCWFRYMEELSRCQATKGKDCVKRLSALEQVCNNHNDISVANAKIVLGEN